MQTVNIVIHKLKHSVLYFNLKLNVTVINEPKTNKAE